jgi:exodeoxyribonuclease VIII
MIDMETLGVTPDCMILTIGAVHFDPYGTGIIDKLYLKVGLDEQEQLGRIIDPKTLEWWSKQNADVLEEALSDDNRIPLTESVDKLHKFFWGCKRFWSHGSVFDLIILENLYRQMKKPLPWNFWDLRDTRTIFDLGHDPEMPQNSKHDALQDAIRQAIGVQNVYRKLGLEPK